MDPVLKKRVEGLLLKKIPLIESHLDKVLLPADEFPSILHEAMRYTVFAEGKRLRPFLILQICELLGGDVERGLDDAVAIELFHTQSLVLDDLPAMDDDDYRRGQLACHKKYGEDIALMVSSGLNALAYQVISPEYCRYVTGMLGTKGMIGGQIVDIQFQKKPETFSREDIRRLHQMKTGNGIEASVVLGAKLAGSSQKVQDKMAIYGRYLGLLFQITDDALDDNDYVRVVGEEQTRIDIEECVDKALLAIDFIEEASRQVMKDIILYVKERTA